jgi:hypothetical protein
MNELLSTNTYAHTVILRANVAGKFHALIVPSTPRLNDEIRKSIVTTWLDVFDIPVRGEVTDEKLLKFADMHLFRAGRVTVERFSNDRTDVSMDSALWSNHLSTDIEVMN